MMFLSFTTDIKKYLELVGKYREKINPSSWLLKETGFTNMALLMYSFKLGHAFKNVILTMVISNLTEKEEWRKFDSYSR